MFNGAISGWNLFFICEIGLVFLVLTYKLRRKFPAKVNCWFCNTNSNVPYLLRNSWTCDKCDQYNGFSADGGYNRDVPAQYCTKLNWSPIRGRCGSSVASIKSYTPSNGLCDSCNRNQCLKVQQLASFIPQNEHTYDEEVELYRRHLDEAYALCKDCEGVLRRQLNRVKKRILGLKLTKAALILASKTPIVSNGDNNSTNTLHSIAAHMAVALGGLNFFIMCQRMKFSEIALPPFVREQGEIFILHISTIMEILLGLGKYLVSFVHIEMLTDFFAKLLAPISTIYTPTNAPEVSLNEIFSDVSTVHVMGIIISLLVLWKNDSGRQNRAIMMFLGWSASLCDSYVEEKSMMTNVIFILISAATLLASFYNLTDDTASSRDIVDMGKTFHRLYADCSDSDDDDTADSEELERSAAMSHSTAKYPMRKFMENCYSPSVASSPRHKKSCESLNETFYTVNSSISPTFGRAFADIDGRVSRSSICAPRSPHRFGECSLKSGGSPGSTLNESFFSFGNRSGFSDSNATAHCDFRSVQAVPTEEFSSAIGKLRIDDVNGIMTNSMGNLWQRTSPLVQQRSTFVMAQTSPKNQQNSWVAGGFWGGSPIKKPLIRSHILNTATYEDLEKVESRSSSLSSGFESRPSSVHGHMGVHNNSRESSVSGDPEVALAFSEPLSQRNFNCNTSRGLGGRKNDRPLPVFPVINSSTQAFIHPSKFDSN